MSFHEFFAVSRCRKGSFLLMTRNWDKKNVKERKEELFCWLLCSHVFKSQAFSFLKLLIPKRMMIIMT